MTKLTRTLLLLAAPIALTVSSAEAQVFFENICSPGAFKVCASAHTFLDGNNLIIEVWNENQNTTGMLDAMAAYSTETGGHHTIFAIGLTNLGPITGTNTTLVGDYLTSDGSTELTNWVLGAQSLQIALTAANTSAGHKQGIVGCFDPASFGGNASKQEHVNTCNSSFDLPFVRFTISNLSGLTLENLENSVFEFHSAQVAMQNCVVDPNAEDAPDCLTENSLKGAGVAVPEPLSVVLLASGLFGIVALRRRRISEDLD